MDCSEDEDFALLFLAEAAVIPKKNRRTNKTKTQTNKHTNVTNIIVLCEVISVALRLSLN